MYELIESELLFLIGYYDNNGRKLAICRNYAINSPVFGLEVVICDTNSANQGYMGSARSALFATTIFLTQHEGGKDTIDRAVEGLRKVQEWNVQVRWVRASKGDNVRRAIIDIAHVRCC